MSIYVHFIACRESHLLQLDWKIVFIDGPEFLFLLNKHTFCQSQLQFQCFPISLMVAITSAVLYCSTAVVKDRIYSQPSDACSASKFTLFQLFGQLISLTVASMASWLLKLFPALSFKRSTLKCSTFTDLGIRNILISPFCSFSPVLTSPWPPCTRCSRRWEGSPLCCSCCFSARMCSTCQCAFVQIKVDKLLECYLCWVQACPAKASQPLLRPLSFTLEDIFTFTQRLSTIHLW